MASFFGTKRDETYSGGDAIDLIFGKGGDDVLSGLGGDDTIEGGGGDDVITGGAGMDLLSGGTGNDVFVIDKAADHVTGESLRGGAGDDTLDLTGSVSVDISTWTLAEIETVAFDVIAMTSAQLQGFTTIGGYQATLTTGGTIDLADKVLEITGLSLSEAGNVVIATGSAWTDYTIWGGDGADMIVGNDGFASFHGDGGDDVIRGGNAGGRYYGGSGNDVIEGGSGVDLLSGGEGIDTVLAGDGADLIVLFYRNEHAAGDVYDGGEGFDGLELGYFNGSTTDITDWAIYGIEGLTAFRGVSMSVAQANGFESFRIAELRLVDGGLVDFVGKTLDVGAIVLSDAGNTVILPDISQAGWTVNGGGGNDTVTGGAAVDTLGGRGGDDVLRGGGGDDIITGGFGADLLIGSAGRDILTGDGGKDVYRFRDGDLADTSTNADRITDFAQTGGDRIDLRFVDAMAGTSADEAFTFIGTAAFSGLEGELRYASAVSGTVIEADRDGDGVADGYVLLDQPVALVAEDFVL